MNNSNNIKKQKNEDQWRLQAVKGGKQIELPANPLTSKEDYIELLCDFMLQKAEECDFLAAETARLKVEELKGLLTSHQTGELLHMHSTEKLDLQQAHQQEIQHFHLFWDNKLSMFQEEGQRMQQELHQRHQQEHLQYTKELEDGLNKVCKDSQQLLDAKLKRDILSKQRQYIDAHLLQVEIDCMQQQEMQVFTKDRQAKIHTLLNHLAIKHQQESQALQQRLHKATTQHHHNKAIELDRLELKYQVVLKEIDNRQSTEQNLLKKRQKSSGNNSSRYLTQSKFSQSRSRLI